MIRTALFCVASFVALSSTCFAHKVWLRPSQTSLSGSEPWVTVDAAVSNDLFYFNHFPLGLDGLVVIGPEGKEVAAQNESVGKYRSVFDVALEEQGTYRIAVLNKGMFASWEEGGERKRWRGTPATFDGVIPEGATNVSISESIGRVETFVTNGAPTGTALESTGEGIELAPVSHPNDLYAGEEGTFQLLVNGKPAPEMEIEIIQGGTRYRNAQDSARVKTDDEGKFSYKWPEAGMYWLSTSKNDTDTSIPNATQRRLSYTATLEVLPQ
ncbi:DUF4198 domain-containing protein [Rhodopirellula sp. MGV]|uniref:DUF4198 domain-containing protein n=1 Tax=Rhodopirellula sp. MGV TaxID=2023130 RepID=UPI000B95E771|nr:DUF4198 domain-containing protein [Rhodopirellula sp. MGV]OYP34219.1 ABC transporter permease [Rhodopirellula sp. MGV]PNY35037.1 DUF4198 domain-containing protein [Rhodopirellula baltica]